MTELNDLLLVSFITDRQRGAEIVREAHKIGFVKGNIIRAFGTKPPSIINLFSGYEDEKNITVFATTESVEEVNEKLKKLNEIFRFDEPNHGIVFTEKLLGKSKLPEKRADKLRGDDKKMYKSIITIVERGKGEDVITAAASAGSKGGTIIKSRAAGLLETKKVFNMEIEPEMEMVMIIASSDKAEKITDSINSALKLDEPGNGIMFVQNLENVWGIVE